MNHPWWGARGPRPGLMKTLVRGALASHTELWDHVVGDNIFATVRPIGTLPCSVAGASVACSLIRPIGRMKGQGLGRREKAPPDIICHMRAAECPLGCGMSSIRRLRVPCLRASGGFAPALCRRERLSSCLPVTRLGLARPRAGVALGRTEGGSRERTQQRGRANRNRAGQEPEDRFACLVSPCTGWLTGPLLAGGQPLQQLALLPAHACPVPTTEGWVHGSVTESTSFSRTSF